MNIVDPLGGFQFDEDDVFDEQVNGIVPDHNPIISNNDAMSLRDGEPSLPELVHQSVFIDFLKKSASQRGEHRQGTANDSSGQEVNPVLAGLYLRVRRVLRFHFPCLLPEQPFQIVNASKSRAARRVDILVSADVHQDVEAPGSARRRRSEGKENGTANHAEHAKGDGAF
jgi:hypothetical protein